jgi:hypothetical protein
MHFLDALFEEPEFRLFREVAFDFFPFEIRRLAENEGDDAGFEFRVGPGLKRRVVFGIAVHVSSPRRCRVDEVWPPTV